MGIKVGQNPAAPALQQQQKPAQPKPPEKGPESIGDVLHDLFEHVGALFHPGADPAEPALDNPAFERYETRNLPLDVNGITVDDVKQGTLGDCYFVSSVAAIADSRPDLIQKAMRQNPDGSVTFRFYQRGDDGSLEPVDETVDRRVVIDLLGQQCLGHAKDRELWFPLMEKAYAQLKGDSYQAIGHGGYPNDALEALLGQPSQYLPTDPDELFAQLTLDLKNGYAVSAWTDSSDATAGTGVEKNHAYSVLGTSEQNGQRCVIVRNPWGFGEPGSIPEVPLPFAADGKNDGTFRLPLDVYARCFPYAAECLMPAASPP